MLVPSSQCVTLSPMLPDSHQLCSPAIHFLPLTSSLRLRKKTKMMRKSSQNPSGDSLFKTCKEEDTEETIRVNHNTVADTKVEDTRVEDTRVEDTREMRDHQWRTRTKKTKNSSEDHQWDQELDLRDHKRDTTERTEDTAITRDHKRDTTERTEDTAITDVEDQLCVLYTPLS